jgi:hypothetical protein
MRWEKRKKWEALHSIALGNYIPTMNDDDDHLFSLSRLGWRDKVALAFNYNPRRKVKTDETGRTLIIIEKAEFYFILSDGRWGRRRTWVVASFYIQLDIAPQWSVVESVVVPFNCHSDNSVCPIL